MRVRVKKYKVVINNKLKGSLGAMDPKTNKIEINRKAHKGDKKELASTLKHELLHVKHPKMTEKEVYKRSAKTKISPEERHKLLSRLQNARRERGVKAVKRKLKIDPNAKVEPGDLFNKAKENQEQSGMKGLTTQNNITQVAIRGLV